MKSRVKKPVTFRLRVGQKYQAMANTHMKYSPHIESQKVGSQRVGLSAVIVRCDDCVIPHVTRGTLHMTTISSKILYAKTRILHYHLICITLLLLFNFLFTLTYSFPSQRGNFFAYLSYLHSVVGVLSNLSFSNTSQTHVMTNYCDNATGELSVLESLV